MGLVQLVIYERGCVGETKRSNEYSWHLSCENSIRTLFLLHFFFLKQVICKEGKKVILKFISSGVFETVYDNVVK